MRFKIEKDFELLFKHQIPEEMIDENGNRKKILNEKTVVNDRTVKLIIKSNEITSHSLPHVHAISNNKECVISLESQPHILEKGECKVNICNNLIKDYVVPNLLELRKAWNNNCNSQCMFLQNEDGTISDTIIKR